MARAQPPPEGEPERFALDALEGLPPELAMARLPAGRHGLPRSFVTSNQRLRIIAAMLRLLPEHGYPALTIGHVTAEAGVSRAAFYEHFSSKEECFLATQAVSSRWFCERVEAAVADADEWKARIRLGAAEALRLLAGNVPVAHLIAIEALRAGPTARERQQEMLDRFAAALGADRPGRAELPDDIATLLLGGAAALVARYVSSGRAEQLPEATAALVEYLVIPYLGGEEAGATLA